MMSNQLSKTIYCVTNAKFLLFLLLSYTTYSQELVIQNSEEFNKKLLNIYKSNEIISFEIRAPFNEIFSQRVKNKYFNGRLRFSSQDTYFPIRISVRGNSNLISCSFPKLKIKYQNSMSNIKTTLKIATHCDNTEQFNGTEDGLEREAIIYDFLSINGFKSYKIRRANVSYIDSNTNNKIEKKAFLIETTKQMVNRVNAEKITYEHFLESKNLINLSDVIKVLIVQKLIGNTDWEFDPYYNTGSDNIYNLKLFKMVESGEIVPVPLDFDRSQIVIKKSPYKILKRPGVQSLYNKTILLNKSIKFFAELKNTFSGKLVKNVLNGFKKNEEKFINHLNSSNLSTKSKGILSQYFKAFYNAINLTMDGNLFELSQNTVPIYRSREISEKCLKEWPQSAIGVENQNLGKLSQIYFFPIKYPKGCRNLNTWINTKYLNPFFR